jgi:hypothetical protein
MPSPVEEAIRRVCRETAPGTRKRMNALASVQWVLATKSNRFVRVDDGLSVALTPQVGNAMVFDGRDNETTKRQFMQALLGEPLTVVILK